MDNWENIYSMRLRSHHILSMKLWAILRKSTMCLTLITIRALCLSLRKGRHWKHVLAQIET